MNLHRKLGLASVFASVLGFVSLMPWATVQAQTLATPAPQPEAQASSDVGWHVGITPYIWFAGVHGTSGILGREASVHADFGDIFNYLNIGAMGVMDLRYNRVIMPVDFLWMKLSDNQGLPVNELGVNSINAKMTETILSPKIGYRIADGKRVKVDALFGARYWHLSTTFTLQPQIRGGLSQSANWADAVAGGRIEFALTPKASATIFGDAGGGSARLDYQVGGALGYKVSRRWVLLVGYRYLSVDYRSTGNAQFVYDVDMPGLAVGATFNVK
ncbi:MAG: hypothetical protein WAK48_21550 [Candidatus Acidiferrum sp.]